MSRSDLESMAGKDSPRTGVRRPLRESMMSISQGGFRREGAAPVAAFRGHQLPRQRMAQELEGVLIQGLADHQAEAVAFLGPQGGQPHAQVRFRERRLGFQAHHAREAAPVAEMPVALVLPGLQDRHLAQQIVAHAAVLDEDDVPGRLALVIEGVIPEQGHARSRS